LGFDDEAIPKELFYSYLQDAFQISNERHNETLAVAVVKQVSEIRLNVEVVEAKELPPKRPDGQCDPFVTMYVQSNPIHHYNTTVQSKTLCPTWKEHFSL
jgi:BAI1-associated protein 3